MLQSGAIRLHSQAEYQLFGTNIAHLPPLLENHFFGHISLDQLIALLSSHPSDSQVLHTAIQQFRASIFFYCVAERAVKPCRSSRSNTRGGMIKSHDTCRTGSKHKNPNNKNRNQTQTRQTRKTGGKCQWMVRHVVKRK